MKIYLLHKFNTLNLLYNEALLNVLETYLFFYNVAFVIHKYLIHAPTMIFNVNDEIFS